MSPIEVRIQKLRSNLDHINLVKSEFKVARFNPKKEKLRSKILDQLEQDSSLHLQEIKTLTIILDELNSDKIKSMVV
ncbi:hypothetical protein [Leptospira levettii]|uniref:hypothetical protein n=1 Tax=Leptospira levettii TaxID=2023178 RepID=UPI000C29FBB8|nr:hypothetical protein [Leptospira levettii]PJZ87487.1 hypothetical protein CH368_16625 [Leptospira levettii]